MLCFGSQIALEWHGIKRRRSIQSNLLMNTRLCPPLHLHPAPVPAPVLARSPAPTSLTYPYHPLPPPPCPPPSVLSAPLVTTFHPSSLLPSSLSSCFSLAPHTTSSLPLPFILLTEVSSSSYHYYCCLSLPFFFVVFHLGSSPDDSSSGSFFSNLLLLAFLENPMGPPTQRVWKPPNQTQTKYQNSKLFKNLQK